MRCLVRWLCHNDITCGNGRNNWIYKQQIRIVPGRKDKHAPLGLVMENAFGCWQKEHSTSFLIAHPFFQMADGVINFFDNRENFAKPCLKFGLVKVQPNGVVKVNLPLDYGITEFFQFFYALFGGRLRNFPTILTLCVENPFNVFFLYFVHTQ